MKLIISLLLIIPSLSWGLTFKDGKQVGSEDSFYVDEGFEWKIDCGVDEGAITRDGEIWVFKESKNYCSGLDWIEGATDKDVLKQNNFMSPLRTEIVTINDVPVDEFSTYEFESFFSIGSNSNDNFHIFQLSDGGAECAKPLMITIDENNKIMWKSDYKIVNPDDEIFPLCESINYPKGQTNILRDGTQYKLSLILNFKNNGSFDAEIFIDDNLEISGTYEIPKDGTKKNCFFKEGTNHITCEDTEIKYIRPKWWIFKHGLYSSNNMKVTLKSNWKLKKLK